MKFCQVFHQSKYMYMTELHQSKYLAELHQSKYMYMTELHQSKYLAELHHFCINMIVKIPGRTSSFLMKFCHVHVF
jgi:hypothetical protein